MQDKLLIYKALITIVLDQIAAGYDYWKRDIKGHRLDEYLCCDGHQCGCNGETIYDAYCAKRK